MRGPKTSKLPKSTSKQHWAKSLNSKYLHNFSKTCTCEVFLFNTKSIDNRLYSFRYVLSQNLNDLTEWNFDNFAVRPSHNESISLNYSLTTQIHPDNFKFIIAVMRSHFFYYTIIYLLYQIFIICTYTENNLIQYEVYLWSRNSDVGRVTYKDILKLRFFQLNFPPCVLFEIHIWVYIEYWAKQTKLFVRLKSQLNDKLVSIRQQYIVIDWVTLPVQNMGPLYPESKKKSPQWS